MSEIPRVFRRALGCGIVISGESNCSFRKLTRLIKICFRLAGSMLLFCIFICEPRLTYLLSYRSRNKSRGINLPSTRNWALRSLLCGVYELAYHAFRFSLLRSTWARFMIYNLCLNNIKGTWIWLADHDLDENSQGQITTYAGRGVLSESHGPVWMIGTACLWISPLALQLFIYSRTCS